MRKETTRGTRKAREESGQPGAGKGRREVVRGSRIYPASGPLPPGRAKIKTEASLGRREQPAAATRKTGRTTRTTPKRSAAPRGAESMALWETPRDIPREQWRDFLDHFSAAHERWLTTIEIVQPDQTSRIEAQDLPFEGVSVDTPGSTATEVIAGNEPREHVTHTIPRTRRITLKARDELELEAEDGTKISVRCRSPQD